MKSGHFNLGNVWGRVKKADQGETRDKGTPYLDLEIDCANPALGNGRAFGRMWGREKIDALIEEIAKQPARPFRFKGFYDQYEDHHGHRFSSYTFYEYMPEEPGNGFVPRAAFILVGDLVKKELVTGEGVIALSLTRPGKEDPAVVVLHLHDVMPFYDVTEGDLVEARGTLRKREAEDFYGGSTTDLVRPYVMVLKKRERKA